MDEEDRYTRITLRIPKDLDRKLQESADATSKSKNAEIISRLEQSLQGTDPDEALRSILHAQKAQAAAEARQHIEKGMLRYLSTIYQVVDKRLRPIAQAATNKELANVLDAGKLVTDSILAESGEDLMKDFDQIMSKVDSINQKLASHSPGRLDVNDQQDVADQAEDIDPFSSKSAAKAIDLYRRATKK